MHDDDVVWVTVLPRSGKSALACAVEIFEQREVKDLFRRARQFDQREQAQP